MRSLLFALSLTLFAAPALASDRKDNGRKKADVVVAIADLPPAVTQAIEARYPGATLSKAEKEGKSFEVDIQTPDGQHLEVDITAKGKITEVETQDEPDNDESDDEREKDKDDDE